MSEMTPDTRTRRRLGRTTGSAATAFALAVGMMGTTLPTPLYALYRQRFGFSELMLTVIFAVYAAGVIGGLLFLGPLSDQIGRRFLLLPALGLSALSACVFLVADGVPLLLAGRVISGLSAGIFTGTATATLVDLARPERRNRATLVAAVANMGGLGLGVLLAGLVSQWTGSPLQNIFWVDLALLVPAAIAIWAMPEPGRHTRHPHLRPRLPRVPSVVRPAFARATLAVFAGFAVLGLFTAVSPDFLGQDLGVTNRAVVGLIVFSVFAASTAGQAMCTLLPEELPLPAGCVGLIIGMALLALSLAASSLALLVLAGITAGVGHGLSFRAGLAGLNTGTPAAERAEVASSFFLVAYIAISAPVIGEGALAQAIGLRPAGLTFAAAVASLAAIAVALLAPTRRRRARPWRAPVLPSPRRVDQPHQNSRHNTSHQQGDEHDADNSTQDTRTREDDRIHRPRKHGWQHGRPLPRPRLHRLRGGPQPERCAVARP